MKRGARELAGAGWACRIIAPARLPVHAGSTGHALAAADAAYDLSAAAASRAFKAAGQLAAAAAFVANILARAGRARRRLVAGVECGFGRACHVVLAGEWKVRFILGALSHARRSIPEGKERHFITQKMEA